MNTTLKTKNPWLVKWIFIWIGISFWFLLLVVCAGIFAYMKGFFDDNWGKSWIEIDRDVDTSNERTINVDETNKQETQTQDVGTETNSDTNSSTDNSSWTDTYIKDQTNAIFNAFDKGQSEVEAMNNWEREKDALFLELEKEKEKNKTEEEKRKLEEEKQRKILEEQRLKDEELKRQEEIKNQAKKEQAQQVADTIDNHLISSASSKISINDIDFVNLYEKNNNPSFRDFLTTYYFLYQQKFSLTDFITKWEAFDLANKPNIDFQSIITLRKPEITEKDEVEFLQKKKNIVAEMKKSKSNANGNWVVINPCFYTFCSWNNHDIYAYVKKAMIKDDELKAQLEVARKDWISPKFYLTILLIENVRMHTQYKQNFKNMFLKYASPKLAVMSQFSYGKYGTKVNFITRLINANYGTDTLFSIWDFHVLKEIKDNFYTQNPTTKQWYTKNEWVVAEWLIKNKQAQTDIISAFFKMAAQGWKTKNIDLWKRENAGILLTLYNLWRLWEPKTNPELWWATLDFTPQRYNFGQLANVIYNSLELDDIMQQMKL